MSTATKFAAVDLLRLKKALERLLLLEGKETQQETRSLLGLLEEPVAIKQHEPKRQPLVTKDASALAQNDKERQACYKLRFAVYITELQRFHYKHVDLQRKTIEDPLDHVEGVSHLFVAAPTGKVITNELQE